MTIIVVRDGVIAADSKISRGSQATRNTFKIVPLKNIVYVPKGENKPIAVKAYGCAGLMTSIDAVFMSLTTLDQKPEGADLAVFITHLSNVMLSLQVTIVLLLADGRRLVLRVDGYLKDKGISFHKADEITRIGSGAELATECDNAIFDGLSAGDLVYMSTRLSRGCGGVIVQYTLADNEFGIYNLTEDSKARILQCATKALFDNKPVSIDTGGT